MTMSRLSRPRSFGFSCRRLWRDGMYSVTERSVHPTGKPWREVADFSVRSRNAYRFKAKMSAFRTVPGHRIREAFSEERLNVSRENVSSPVSKPLGPHGLFDPGIVIRKTYQTSPSGCMSGEGHRRVLRVCGTLAEARRVRCLCDKNGFIGFFTAKIDAFT